MPAVVFSYIVGAFIGNRTISKDETMDESTALSPAKATRYGFIDLLRGVALVVMVETHVMNAYLPLALKKGSDFFFWLAFTNGLVAPTFLLDRKSVV